jgi:hypothetical protein
MDPKRFRVFARQQALAGARHASEDGKLGGVVDLEGGVKGVADTAGEREAGPREMRREGVARIGLGPGRVAEESGRH